MGGGTGYETIANGGRTGYETIANEGGDWV